MGKFILLFVACAAAGFLSGAVAAHFPGDSSEWASWVQAVGSIAAIIAAYILASPQQRTADRAAMGERTRTRYRAASYAIAVLEEAMIAMAEFSMQLARQNEATPLTLELTRPEASLTILMTALHQPLPSEILEQVLIGLRAVQTQTRLARRANQATYDQLTEFTDTHLGWVKSAHSKVEASREKWRFKLNEASLEEQAKRVHAAAPAIFFSCAKFAKISAVATSGHTLLPIMCTCKGLENALPLTSEVRS